MGIWKDKSGLKNQPAEETCVEIALQDLKQVDRELKQSSLFSPSGDAAWRKRNEIERDLRKEKGVWVVRSGDGHVVW